MELNSLGLQTEMIFYHYWSEIIDKKNYRVIKTPTNPTFFYGNLIIFKNQPQPGQAKEWDELFQSYFADQPQTTHRVFVWDHEGLEPPITPEAKESFEGNGFSYESCWTLELRELTQPPYPKEDLEIRPLDMETEYEELFQLQLKASGAPYNPESYRPFLKRRLQGWHHLVQKGQGIWWGAYEKGKLVGDCGLFWQDGLARFQNVETHPEHRRQGICGTLIHFVSDYARRELNLETIVIEVEEDSAPERIYRSLGYAPVEIQGSFLKRDKEKWVRGDSG